MNLTEKAKLRTYLKLKDFFALYNAILALLPNFAAVLGDFTAFLNSILALLSVQTQNKQGINNAKKDSRKKLAQLTDDIKNKLNSYALFTNDFALLAETDKSEKAILRMADAELYGFAQLMYNRAQAKLASLATYNVTAATQTALQAACSNFLAFIPKPGEGVNDSKQTAVKLSDVFKSQDLTMAKIDSLMSIIKYVQPAVYAAYQDAAQVIPIGRRKDVVHCSVLDAVTQVGIKGVQFTFTLVADAQNKAVESSEPIIRTSSKKGGLRVKSMQAGTYQVKVVYTGFYEEETSLVYNGNDFVKLNVYLKRIEKALIA